MRSLWRGYRELNPVFLFDREASWPSDPNPVFWIFGWSLFQRGLTQRDRSNLARINCAGECSWVLFCTNRRLGSICFTWNNLAGQERVERSLKDLESSVLPQGKPSYLRPVRARYLRRYSALAALQIAHRHPSVYPDALWTATGAPSSTSARRLRCQTFTYSSCLSRSK